MADVTRILTAIEKGDPRAAEDLLPLVYAELRRLAAHKLAHEPPGQTLSATALVHDAYLRLVGRPLPPGEEWKVASSVEPGEGAVFSGRGHFFAAAAEAMRRILVERARQRRRLKHGGGRRHVDLDSGCLAIDEPTIDLLALDEALSKLAAEQPAKAELVKLKFFAGLTMPEAAAAMNISLATAERYWAFARGWLYAELAESGSDQPE
jgi:DNA-directed RNA polymerase specialized sigma24 family protein